MKNVKHSNFLHHRKNKLLSGIEEIVFGAEDGMVSTLGALTGVAAGTSNRFTVVLVGMIIVSVESISMGIGSYLSNKSSREVDDHMIDEEKIELKETPEYEKRELYNIYLKDGWPKSMAKSMAETASQNKKLFLKEMVTHELNVFKDKNKVLWQLGLLMFISYVIGGAIPVLPYILLNLPVAIYFSVGFTLFCLFLLGVMTTLFTKRNWWKAGLEMFSLATVAVLVGYFVGQIADKLLQ